MSEESNYKCPKHLIGEDGEIDIEKFAKLQTNELSENRIMTFDVNPEPLINLVGLLTKYMNHVRDMEGVDFVDSIGCFPSEEFFTKEEVILLEGISKENTPE
jgi:hypothetical protein